VSRAKHEAKCARLHADARGVRPTSRALLAVAVAIAAILASGPVAASAHRPSSPGATASRHHGTRANAHNGHRRHRKSHRRAHPKRHQAHPGRTAHTSRRGDSAHGSAHGAGGPRNTGNRRPSSGSAGGGSAGHGAARSSFQCAGANLMPDEEDLAEVRSATICLVNRERVLHGERPLTVNGKLGRAAQGHSEDMIAQDYFSHYGPAGDTPAGRMRAAGYIYSSNIGYEVGENIAWGTMSLATPKSIVEAWMHSPGHRENILDARYRETGMGVVAAVPRSDSGGQPGATYTQDFGVLISG
jgi:uncharacterized protein YkwD